jgi:molybdopterin-containing oxidoreductase family membrane subunit
MIEFSFQDKKKFMEKLNEVYESGFSPKKVRVILPHPDHDVEHLVEEYLPKSKLKYFSLAGALAGCILGFGFTAFTVLDWPLITGGKPLLSWPAFVVIAFELTILLGAIVSFGGFLFLAKMPDFKGILTPEDHGNEYVIQIENEDKK